MTRRVRFAVIVAAFAGMLTAVPEARQTRPEGELRQAMDLETIKGDVKSAMAQYQVIADRYRDANRAVASLALFRLAQLQERLGNSEAEKTYERVATDFPEQPSGVDARKKLAGLRTGESNGAKALRLAHSGSFLGLVSPNGRYLAHDNWPLGDKLIVKDLATRRQTSHELTAFDVAFSRDSSRIGYGHCTLKRKCEIRIARSGTAEPPRTAYRVEGSYAGVMDWSPDGRSLAIFINRQADRTLQFGFLDVATGSFRRLKTVEWGGGTIGGVFSPDGRDIAINVRVAEHSGKRDIFLMSVDATREHPIVVSPADEFVLGWTADGKHLLYGSDSSGAVGIWAQPMSDRKPLGASSLVAPNIGTDVSRAGLSEAGALYLGIRARTSTAEVASIDLQTGKRTSAPTRPIRTVADFHQAAEWSRDGKSLSYIMSRNGRLLLGIHAIETGMERELDVSASLDRIASSPCWAPDGSLVAYGRDLKGRYGVFRIDTADARVTPLVFRGPEGRAGVEGFFWSPDGSKMYYRAATAGHGPIIERDVASGAERTIVEGQFRSMSLSPDGRWFAVLTGGTLSVLAVAGGPSRQLLAGVTDARPEWTPDSQSILVQRSLTAETSDMVLVKLNGGTSSPLEFNARLRLSPDGRSIVYPAGEDRAEIWSLQNFLPIGTRR